MITTCETTANILRFRDMTQEEKYKNMTLEEMSRSTSKDPPRDEDFYVAWAGKVAAKIATFPPGESLKKALATIAKYEQYYGISSEEYSEALLDGRLKHDRDISKWGFAIQWKKHIERRSASVPS